MFVVPMVLALSTVAAMTPAVAQDTAAPTSFTKDQIDNLVGPVALYPDALLAQVLVAATFPDQIDAAVRYVRANGTNGIDDQPWDVSVKSVAHYPTTLNMMADKLDWTTALGQAYASQSSDVMQSVQHLRSMANSQGNLVSTPQQTVAVDDGNYVITPAQAQIIYVPAYDPYVIYNQPVYDGGGWGGYWSFGVGFPIGSWLSYDMDWRGRRVFYDGWNGGGWRLRSRPFIRFSNVYVNPRFSSVYINRDVIHRSVNFQNVERYNGVHRDVHFEGRGNDGRPFQGTGNRIIDRNIDHRDPHLNDYRGRTPGRPVPASPTPVRPTPGVHMPAPSAIPPAPHAFGQNEGRFDPTVAGRRGEASRAQPTAQAPVRPAPRQAQPAPRQAQPAPRQAQPAARPAQRQAAPQARGGRRPSESDGQDQKKKP
jgi:hypothetical protein